VLDALAAQLMLARGQLSPALQCADRQASEPSDLLVSAPPGSALFALVYECEHRRVAPAQVWLAHGRAARDRARLERALALGRLG
jgi:hypothetical protein